MEGDWIIQPSRNVLAEGEASVLDPSVSEYLSKDELESSAKAFVDLGALESQVQRFCCRSVKLAAQRFVSVLDYSWLATEDKVGAEGRVIATNFKPEVREFSEMNND